MRRQPRSLAAIYIARLPLRDRPVSSKRGLGRCLKQAVREADSHIGCIAGGWADASDPSLRSEPPSTPDGQPRSNQAVDRGTPRAPSASRHAPLANAASHVWAERPEVRLGLHAQFGKEPGVLRVKCVGRQTLWKTNPGETAWPPGQLQLFCSAIVIKPYVDWKRFLTPFLPPDGQFGLANRRPGEVVHFP